MTDPEPDRCPTCNEPGDPTWCPTCAGRVTTAIASLTEHCQHLIAGPLQTGHDITPGTHHNLGVDPPSPSPSWDLCDEVVRWAVAAEDTLRAHLHHADRTQEHHRTLSPAITYLVAQAPSLLAGPHATTTGLHALTLAKHLEQATGQDTPTTRLPEPCPHCSQLGALEHVDGADTVHCKDCGFTFSWAHYIAIQAYSSALT